MTENPKTHIICFNPSTNESGFDSKKRLYHYTSPHGLNSILSNSKFRFSDCQFLNDKSEYTHIKKPLMKAFEQIRGELHNDFEESILSMIQENFEHDDIKVMGKGSSLSLQVTKKRYYIFCTSMAQDSLGMWNYYLKGGNYQGYNIGFNISQLLDCFSDIRNSNIDVFYGEIVYKEKDQINRLKDMLLRVDQVLEDRLRNTVNEEDIDISDQEAKGEVLSYIENFRLFFKDEAFSNEKEFRFVIKLPIDYTPDDTDPIKIGFDVKNGVFTPFCELSINKEKTINSIMLSPMLEIDLAKQGIERFLRQNGYNGKIIIGQSKVPIRY